MVLVTGGCGFIGSHLVDRLIDKGFEVAVIDNLSTGSIDNLNPKARFFEWDISDKRIWDMLPKYDCVFHVAALARIQPSIKEPVAPHNANVNGTLNVLEYCRKHGSKLIFSGSSSVFKGDKLPTNEESEIAPRSPYSLYKHVNEQYIRLWGELYGLDYVILRYFNVYGERMLLTGGYTTVLGVFLDATANKQPLQITGDGEQRRDFTYVGDVVEANLLATNWNGTFNIGRGKNYSVNEIADIVGGKKAYVSARPGEVRQTLCDNKKARSLGWEPAMDIEKWLNSPPK